MRVKFRKGEQRKFLDAVISKINSPSLRGLIQFGLDVKYSALKNYYNELRLLPEDLFIDMCKITELNEEDFGIELLEDNWGRAKGGKIRSNH